MSSRENEARFLRQNEVNLRDREIRKPDANTKLDFRSFIVNRDNFLLLVSNVQLFNIATKFDSLQLKS